jgi:hypothetical protein
MGQVPPAAAASSLKALARVVLARDSVSRGCPGATPRRDIPPRPNGPARQLKSGLNCQSAGEPEPILLRDGRRLRRLTAAAVIEARSGQVKALMQTARASGAALWADGTELIVVEQWGRLLPDDVVDELRREAGAVIAELRGEAHARSDWQVFEPPNHR